MTMQSEFMMIDPSELVIDMPVDEANVQLKMNSIRENGIIQPLTIWWQKLRIIDGFHRAVAAHRLNLKEVPCHVIDCTEEAFWDARIQSAKQHHSIEDVRLVAWMFESWKQSRWYASEETAVVLRKRGRELSPAVATMIKTVWTLWRKKKTNPSSNFGNWKKSLDSDSREFATWVEQKASVWGISPDELLDNLMRWANPTHHKHRVDGIETVVEEYGLTFEQRQKFIEETGGKLEGGGKKGIEYVEDWIKDELIYEPLEKVKPLRQYARDRSELLWEDTEKRSWQKKPHTSKVRLAKELAQAKFEKLKGAIHWSYEALREAMDDGIPEAPLLTCQHIEAINKLIFKFYPDSTKEIECNPIWKENLELRKRVAEQAERIISLERALGSKPNPDTLRDALALSSVLIEAQP